MTPNGRYAALPVERRVMADGRAVVFRSRRFVPPASDIASRPELLVGPAERVDQLSSRLLGNPRLWWRLCDASEVLSPSDLEQSGERHLRVPDGETGPAR